MLAWSSHKRRRSPFLPAGVPPKKTFAGETPAPQYRQVVISASHRLVHCRHEELLAMVRGDLEAIWPAARAAKLLDSKVIVNPAAIFSLQPGMEELRLRQKTSIENLTLAGDWTATVWPATMESAVRSGRLAVDAIHLPRAAPNHSI